MKTLLLTLTVLLTTNQAFASATKWICTLENFSDAPVVKALKLPGYLSEIGVLMLNSKYCDQIGPAIYQDFCVIKGHSVAIGLDALQSELHTKKGIRVPLICETIEITFPQ